MNDGLVLTLGGFIFFGVLFLLAREFWCWYFKINERISLERQSLALQRRMVELLSEDIDRDAVCSYCGEPVFDSAKKCPHCHTEFKHAALQQA